MSFKFIPKWKDMPTYMTFTLIMVSITIGTLVGGVGVGGFFMPMALVMLADISIHQAMATSLFTFIFMGIAGTFYFHKKGNIDWELTKPICIGAAFTGYAGAWVGSILSTPILTATLSVIIIGAGLYSLGAGGKRSADDVGRDPVQQWILLAVIGAMTGFMSGLVGIGGSALSVPLMMFFGFSVLNSIGSGQVLQIVGAVSGTVANAKFGSIDFGMAACVAIFEVGGVVLGAYLVHRLDSGIIKKFVGALCLVSGCALILKMP